MKEQPEFAEKIDWFRTCFFSILIAVAILVPTVSLMEGYNSYKRYSQETYQVWVKLTNRHDITYEDWRLAKKHGLLPAQTQAESK